jgi:hypothetical protein
VDDITNEMQMTFVAQSITPWQKLNEKDTVLSTAQQRIYDRVSGISTPGIGMRNVASDEAVIPIPTLTAVPVSR